MTEREFSETINDIYDICDFCKDDPEYDYFIDDLYNSEDIMGYIKELVASIDFDSVDSFIDFADNIPICDWYIVSNYNEIYEACFTDLKSNLLETLRYDDYFEEEEFDEKESEEEEDNKNSTDIDDDIIANDINVLYGE